MDKLVKFWINAKSVSESNFLKSLQFCFFCCFFSLMDIYTDTSYETIQVVQQNALQMSDRDVGQETKEVINFLRLVIICFVICYLGSHGKQGNTMTDG